MTPIKRKRSTLRDKQTQNLNSVWTNAQFEIEKLINNRIRDGYYKREPHNDMAIVSSNVSAACKEWFNARS